MLIKSLFEWYSIMPKKVEKMEPSFQTSYSKGNWLKLLGSLKISGKIKEFEKPRVLVLDALPW